MKKYIFNIILFSSAAGLLWSCTKHDALSPTIDPAGMAYIKVAQLSPNFRAVTGGRDSFNIYVNNVKVNGPVVSYGVFYPTVATLYAAVSAGAKQFRFSFNGTNMIDSSTFVNFTKTLTAGTYYSLLLTDSLLTGNEAKQMLIQDNFVRTDTTHYTMRFVHTILADTVGKNVDVYSMRLGANMFSNIAPGTATAFISVPYNLLADTLIVRRPGTGFELTRLTTVASPLARERAYTLVYKGQPNVIFNATSAPKGRSLVTYMNQ